MYNTYVSSTVSIRCKGSFSFSFNDYSYFLNDRFDRNPPPLSSQSCCACCSNSVYRVPISPNFLYGLRQSALIQWSASRRLFLDGGDRYYCRFPVSDVSRSCCCGLGCPLKERSVSGRRGRLGEGRFRRMVSEEKRGRHCSCDVDDAEVLISLLTEQVGEECFGVRERDGGSSRRMEMEKRGSGTHRNKKKNVTSGLLESNSKPEIESVMIESRAADYRQKEDRRKEDKENFLRGEKRRMRKEGSSSSSYYSSFSLGEFESDSEVQVRKEGCGGESASGLKRDLEESGKVTYDGEIVEEVTTHGDVAGAHGDVMRQEKTAVGSYAASSGVECNWRKKSEKKLTEVSIEQTKSWEKSSNKHTRLLDVHDTGYRKASNSHQQFDDTEEKSTSAVSIDDGTRQQYNRKDGQITGQSESRMFTGVQEIHGSDMEAISSSEKHFSSKEENSSAAGSLVQEIRHEHAKTAGQISQKGDYRRNSQQLNEISKFHDINVRGTSTSQRQSEPRVKKCEDKSTAILSSVQDTEECHHITGQWDSRQMDSRRKFEELTEISGTDNIDINNTSALLSQSDTKMKNKEDNPNFILGSSAKANEQHFQTGQQAIRKTESRKGSQEMSNMSVVHFGDTQVTDTQRASENRISSQETYSASVVKLTEETIEKHNLTEERVFQSESRQWTQRPSKAISFSEGNSKEASSSQASLILKTPPPVHHTGVDVGNKSSLQAIVTPPPSQFVARVSLHVEPTSDFAIQEASSASLESGSDALHTHAELDTPSLQHEIYGGAKRGETLAEPLNFISPEDALGSADRLQQSSMHFIEEFSEKVKHEVSTSKVRKEKRISEKELVNESHKHQQKSVGQYGSGDFKSKEHDSRRSSRSSGVKGPSDEIWDVIDPSIQQPAGTEAPESTTPTTNTIAKRTARSMWNIILDIVRLRWTSRSESHNSTLKSGGRNSPNQSASSEAWFSGHEPDENSDENGKWGKKSISQVSTFSEQQHLITNPTGSQGEGPSSLRSKEKIGHVEVDALSSSSNFESGSASKGISSVSTEENFGRSGTAMVESSVSMPSLHIRRSPHADEISEAGKADVSASGSLLREEQPIGTGLTDVSGTEGKDGELKRRKLQRNNQVEKNRFDDWEEAYKLESEQRKIDEMFMMEALLEAKKAGDMWEVPVGAVLVQNGKIIARGYNLVEELRDSTAHAEMICIREASNLLRTWRLSTTTLYVTLEPCPMCAGAILQARIDTVVWGAPNKLLGADGSWIRLFPNGGEGGNGVDLTDKPPAPVHPFHPKIAIRRGVLASECADRMQQFFQLRRRKKEKKPDSPTPPSCLPISNHPLKFFSKMHDAFHFMFCM